MHRDDKPRFYMLTRTGSGALGLGDLLTGENGIGRAATKLAYVTFARGNLDRAEGFGREALGLFRALNDGWRLGFVHRGNRSSVRQRRPRARRRR
jgi:hypothetical protein